MIIISQHAFLKENNFSVFRKIKEMVLEIYLYPWEFCTLLDSLWVNYSLIILEAQRLFCIESDVV